MDIWMQILVALAAAAIAAPAGAFYQSYRRRARPFTIVEGMGTLLTRGETAQVDNHLIELAKRARTLPGLLPGSGLGIIKLVQRYAQSLIDHTDHLLSPLSKSIRDLERTTDDSEVTNAIIPVLNLASFDFIVTNLAMSGMAFEEPQNDTAKIRVLRSNEDDGSYVLDMPGKPIPFIAGLDRFPIIESRLEPLVRSISALDREALVSDFTTIHSAIRDEVEIARQVKSGVEGILEEYSHWSIESYVANYGHSAMFVEREGTLEVKRGGRWLFSSSLEVPVELIRTEQGQGEKSGASSRGTLLGPNSESLLMFVTLEAEREMTRGRELRGLFEDGQSQARITFNVVSPGVPSRKSVKTAWFPFGGERWTEAEVSAAV